MFSARRTAPKAAWAAEICGASFTSLAKSVWAVGRLPAAKAWEPARKSWVASAVWAG